MCHKIERFLTNAAGVPNPTLLLSSADAELSISGYYMYVTICFNVKKPHVAHKGIHSGGTGHGIQLNKNKDKWAADLTYC
jgi:hypothetical protein